MKILHVIPSVSESQGGPSVAVRLIARSVARLGVDVTIVSTDDEDGETRSPSPTASGVLRPEGVTEIKFRRNTDLYKVSFSLNRWLRQNVGKYDVVHIHALFSFSSTVAAYASHRAGVPYLIRPLGVLSRWGFENRRPFVKRVSLRFVELPIIKHAAAIHYTSYRERRDARALAPVLAKKRSWVVPLPVDPLSNIPEAVATKSNASFPQKSLGQVILFLSRLDRKKGLELLLEAFSRIQNDWPDALLAIAGDGEKSYVRELRKMADRLDIAPRLLWLGFLRGPEKKAAFDAATVFVLPSYSENFGIVAAEALGCGVPVLLSDQVAVADDVREHGAGLVVKCDAGALADGLNRLLSNPALRLEFARKGRVLAAERYSELAVGRQLESVYRFILQQPNPS
jgi:glycosyltransferase involved in cell wall biosynthesis